MEERLDILVAKQLDISREKAKELIKNGHVTVDNKLIKKPAQLILVEMIISVEMPDKIYVSRGGYKLASAIENFEIQVDNQICMDIGASTGGFTDYLLQHGAKRVVAIDVGSNQLDVTLKNNEKVISLENTDIRDVDAAAFPPFDLIVMDVSFISLTHVLNAAFRLLKQTGDCICLVKPQFEAGSQHLNRSGVVRDKKVHQKVMKKIAEHATACGFQIENSMMSAITGKKGNHEYFYYLKKV